MNTKVVTIKEDHIDEEAIQEAGQILKDGGLVAFPTETVYGLGGDALNAESSAKIYAAKGRPSDNPLIVHIADMDALPLIAAEIPESAYLLADAFWPGPLTMIFKRQNAYRWQPPVDFLPWQCGCLPINCGSTHPGSRGIHCRTQCQPFRKTESYGSEICD